VLKRDVKLQLTDFSSSKREYFVDKWHSFLFHAGCLSCHLTHSVESLRGTPSTDPSQGNHQLISSVLDPSLLGAEYVELPLHHHQYPLQNRQTVHAAVCVLLNDSASQYLNMSYDQLVCICDRSARFIHGKYRHVENFSSHSDDTGVKV